NLDLSQLLFVANSATGQGGKNTLQALATLILAAGSAPVKSYTDIAGMLTNTDLAGNFFAYVGDATGDPSLSGGWAIYFFPGGNKASLASYKLLAGENMTAELSTDLVVRNVAQEDHGFSVKDVIRLTEDGEYAKVSDPSTQFRVGIVQQVLNVDSFRLAIHGYVQGLSGLTAGAVYYAQSNGTIGTTETDMPVLHADTTTSGYLLSGNFSASVDPPPEGFDYELDFEFTE